MLARDPEVLIDLLPKLLWLLLGLMKESFLDVYYEILAWF